MTRSFIYAALCCLAFTAAPNSPAELSAAPPPAKAEQGYAHRCYLCQKKNCHGQWKTVYLCYDRCKAMQWYDNQPSNARVIAVK